MILVLSPLWFFAPALATYPFLLLFNKVSTRRGASRGADELAS